MNVIKFKPPRRRRSNNYETQIKRLRILAARLGYALVLPWCAEQRGVPGHGPWVLVRHGTGLNLDEIEQILRDKVRAGAALRPKRRGGHHYRDAAGEKDDEEE